MSTIVTKSQRQRDHTKVLTFSPAALKVVMFNGALVNIQIQTSVGFHRCYVLVKSSETRFVYDLKLHSFNYLSFTSAVGQKSAKCVVAGFGIPADFAFV